MDFKSISYEIHMIYYGQCMLECNQNRIAWDLRLNDLSSSIEESYQYQNAFKWVLQDFWKKLDNYGVCFTTGEDITELVNKIEGTEKVQKKKP